MSEDEIVGFGIVPLKVEGGIYFADGRSFVPGDPGYEEAAAEVEASRAARFGDDHVTLSSGKSYYAPNQYVAIDDKCNDDLLQHDSEAAERIELADLMIARWTEYKKCAKGKR